MEIRPGPGGKLREAMNACTVPHSCRGFQGRVLFHGLWLVLFPCSVQQGTRKEEDKAGETKARWFRAPVHASPSLPFRYSTVAIAGPGVVPPQPVSAQSKIRGSWRCNALTTVGGCTIQLAVEFTGVYWSWPPPILKTPAQSRRLQQLNFAGNAQQCDLVFPQCDGA